jgi:hypothetical protein
MKNIKINLKENVLIAAIISATLVGCDGEDAKPVAEPSAPPKVAESKPANPAPTPPPPAVIQPAAKPVPTPPPAPYHATLEEGIDFGRDSLPDFLQEVKGLMPKFKKESNPNFDGRWSDANSSPTIKIVFKNNLPKKYTLIIDGIAYKTNANVPGKILAGEVSKPFKFSKEILSGKIPATETIRVDIQTKTPTNTIEIVPPHPVTAKEVGGGANDSLKFGYYLRSIKIIPAGK